jgi:hypothetical protein
MQNLNSEIPQQQEEIPLTDEQMVWWEFLNVPDYDEPNEIESDPRILGG